MRVETNLLVGSPVFSGYGVHLVYVTEHQESPPAAFEDVKAIVLDNWQIEKREIFNADFLESLKSRYEIVLDEIPAERILVMPDEASMVNETTEVPTS